MKAIGRDKDGYRIIVEAPAGKTKKEFVKVAKKYIKQGEIAIFKNSEEEDWNDSILKHFGEDLI